MQLTEHFTLEEFTHSETAQRLGIDNTIPSTLIPNLSSLCQHILEPLRQHVQQPVIIGSGYRCHELNKAVGGAKNSLHLTGQAADIILPSTLNLKPSTLREWMSWIIENCQFYKVIWETADRKHFWIHVSYVEDQNKNHVVSYLLKPQAKTR